MAGPEETRQPIAQETIAQGSEMTSNEPGMDQSHEYRDKKTKAKLGEAESQTKQITAEIRELAGPEETNKTKVKVSTF